MKITHAKDFDLFHLALHVDQLRRFVFQVALDQRRGCAFELFRQGLPSILLALGDPHQSLFNFDHGLSSNFSAAGKGGSLTGGSLSLIASGPRCPSCFLEIEKTYIFK